MNNASYQNQVMYSFDHDSFVDSNPLIKEAITADNHFLFNQLITSTELYNQWRESPSKVLDVLFFTLERNNFKIAAGFLKIVSDRTNISDTVNKRHERFGRNALHHVIYLDQFAAVQWLLHYPNIDVHARNVNRETPIQYAINRYRPKIFSLLFNKLYSKKTIETVDSMALLQRSIQYYLFYVPFLDERKGWMIKKCDPVIIECLLQYTTYSKEDCGTLLAFTLNLYKTENSFSSEWCATVLALLLTCKNPLTSSSTPYHHFLNELQRTTLQTIDSKLLQTQIRKIVYQNILEKIAAFQLDLKVEFDATRQSAFSEETVIANTIVKVWAHFQDDDINKTTMVWQWINTAICQVLPEELTMNILWWVFYEQFEPIITSCLPLLPYYDDQKRMWVIHRVFQKLIQHVNSFHQKGSQLKNTMANRPQHSQMIAAWQRLFPTKNYIDEKTDERVASHLKNLLNPTPKAPKNSTFPIY